MALLPYIHRYASRCCITFLCIAMSMPIRPETNTVPPQEQLSHHTIAIIYYVVTQSQSQNCPADVQSFANALEHEARSQECSFKAVDSLMECKQVLESIPTAALQELLSQHAQVIQKISNYIQAQKKNPVTIFKQKRASPPHKIPKAVSPACYSQHKVTLEDAYWTALSLLLVPLIVIKCLENW